MNPPCQANKRIEMTYFSQNHRHPLIAVSCCNSVFIILSIQKRDNDTRDVCPTNQQAYTHLNPSVGKPVLDFSLPLLQRQGIKKMFENKLTKYEIDHWTECNRAVNKLPEQMNSLLISSAYYMFFSRIVQPELPAQAPGCAIQAGRNLPSYSIFTSDKSISVPLLKNIVALRGRFLKSADYLLLLS